MLLAWKQLHQRVDREAWMRELGVESVQQWELLLLLR